MTTREFTPRLDRQITRIVKGASPGLDPLGQPLPPTSTTEVKVWAARRDYRGRDFLSVRDIGLFAITSTRFIVRAEGPAWAIQDVFTDDKGERQVVQGIGEIGRGRWLELLTQGAG